jgi:hypothetical protein
VEVAHPNVTLDVGRDRLALRGARHAVWCRSRLTDHGLREQCVDRLLRDRDAIDLGHTADGVLDHHEVLELAARLDIGVVAAQVDQGIGLAVCQRVPLPSLWRTHALGHVVEHLVDEDRVDVGELPAPAAHPDARVAPRADEPRRCPCLGFGECDRASSSSEALEIARAHP